MGASGDIMFGPWAAYFPVSLCQGCDIVTMVIKFNIIHNYVMNKLMHNYVMLPNDMNKNDSH